MAVSVSRIEEWRDVPGYAGLYSVSSLGRVSNGRGRLLKPRLGRGGYVRAALSRNGEYKHRYVHRLVLEAFAGGCPDGHEVNHKNSVRTDNSIGNLEYVTRLQNAAHREQFGKSCRGEGNGRAKLTYGQAVEIRRRRAAGETYRNLASEFSVTIGAIWFAATGKTWGGSL